ncbi:MAG: Ig-like domain-containing protein, partial [Methanomassiliicoccales archaeon]|nr:Ig-like domain-containing protein [Methanomassiliicoccales archaeon]
YAVSVDGTTWTNVTGTNHTFALVDGVHTAYVRAYDKAGNFNETNVTFTVDTTAPTAEYAPTGDWIPVYTDIVVEFSEVMNVSSVSIVIDGVTGSVSWSGNTVTFNPDSNLNYSTEYEVTVSGKDVAGNELEISWTFNTSKLTSFVGVMVDGNGDPITGVLVNISNGSFSEALTTGSSGYFSFAYDFEISGPFTITASKEGYQTLTVENATFELGGMNDLGDLEMIVEDSGGSDDSDSTLLIVAVVAIVAVLVGAGYFVYLRKKK